MPKPLRRCSRKAAILNNLPIQSNSVNTNKTFFRCRSRPGTRTPNCLGLWRNNWTWWRHTIFHILLQTEFLDAWSRYLFKNTERVLYIIQDLLRPRHGHRTIKYAINELPVLLHIGGDIVKNDTLPVESFDIHSTNSHDLNLSLNFYTDYPEVFYVPRFFSLNFNNLTFLQKSNK